MGGRGVLVGTVEKVPWVFMLAALITDARRVRYGGGSSSPASLGRRGAGRFRPAGLGRRGDESPYALVFHHRRRKTSHHMLSSVWRRV
jgi:hypothetical protein